MVKIVAFWRDLGEIFARWRDVRRDLRDKKIMLYHESHLLLTINKREGLAPTNESECFHSPSVAIARLYAT